MAKQNDFFSSLQGGIWAQPDGPNGDVVYLGCFEGSDLTVPRSEVGRTYCSGRAGGWVVSSRLRTTPADAVSVTLTGLSPAIRHWLEDRDCPVVIYLHQSVAGRQNSFPAFDRGQVLVWAMSTQETEANISTRETNDVGTRAYEIEADYARRYYQPIVEAQTSGATQPLKDVAFVDPARCLGPRGAFSEGNLRGAACAASNVVNVASVIYHTEDGGVTWTAWANDPFNGGGVGDEGDGALSICGFRQDNEVYRWVVTKDNESALNDAHCIAWSDDLTNWTTVVIGAATDVATGPGALFALDAHHMWTCFTNAAGALGFISFSADGGLSWTAQETAAGDALNCIRFIDEKHGICVGDTEEILLTSDGGANWAAPAGLPGKAAVDILACEILDADRMWVTFEDGDLYYTEDGGATWNERAYAMPAGAITASTAAIYDIKFYDDYCGWLVLGFQKTGPAVATAVYRTVNGGQTWTPYQPTETAFSWQSVHPCGYNKVFLVGDVSGGAAQVHKLDAEAMPV